MTVAWLRVNKLIRSKFEQCLLGNWHEFCRKYDDSHFFCSGFMFYLYYLYFLLILVSSTISTLEDVPVVQY